MLAFLSGAWALCYEVVWTREVALVAGGQIEAISVVLVAFFGGLAIGTRWLGVLADRVKRPLLLYAVLEAGAGGLALASSLVLRALNEGPLAALSPGVSLVLCCGLLLPATILLGGALPALLRSIDPLPEDLGRCSGLLTGANTFGAVLGVACAALAIPEVGLRATLMAAGGAALATAGLAHFAARVVEPSTEAAPDDGGPRGVPVEVLLAATLLGVATLGYEVLASRGAMLRLGSSLYAWALVLSLFLAGLALGNLAFASAARRAASPASWLGAIELVAATSVGLGVVSLLPAVTASASGVGWVSIAAVSLAVLPAAICMGAAFPFLVRLARPAPTQLAGGFAKVAAFNTAGGVVGSLAAPFLLLPVLGFANAILATAALNAVVACGALLRAAPGRIGLLRTVGALAVLLAVGAGVHSARPAQPGVHVLSVDHGRQATAVVLHERGERTLVVDGDPEAATGGGARVTEELMASLAVLLHPDPQRILEIGFGSGITLGALTRFPVAEIQCVEIAQSVLDAAPFFAPDNAFVHELRDPRVTITRGDGRTHLARHGARYDVVVANTLHPWSIGSTGLYSREYFERIRGALAPGGVVVQWVALEPVGADTVAAILRTVSQVFPFGSLWWAADNLIVVGRQTPVDELALLGARASLPGVAAGLEPLESLGVGSLDSLGARRIASFQQLAALVADAPVLTDDLPRLERLASSRRARAPGATLELIAELAALAAREDPARSPMQWWIESRVLRLRGETQQAERSEARAVAAGLPFARAAQLEREVARADDALRAGDPSQAAAGFRAVLLRDPSNRPAQLGAARIAHQRGELVVARQLLERLVAEDPLQANPWNLLGALRMQAGDPAGAEQAFAAALRADPFHREALANSGLTQLALDDPAAAKQSLARLRALAPLGATAEQLALEAAIRDYERRAAPL